MEIEFPFEFICYGTPVSHQAKRSASHAGWKQKVREAAEKCLPEGHFASTERLSVTIYYFMAEKAEGDLDNVIKLILDACSKLVFVDDGQVDRLVVERFEPGQDVSFSNPSERLIDGRDGNRPAVYVKIAERLNEAEEHVLFD